MRRNANGSGSGGEEAMIRRRALLGLVAASPLPALAESAPPLSEAQILLFETPHLAALHPPLRLDYDFLLEEAGREPVRDSIRLEVRASAEEFAGARADIGIGDGPVRMHDATVHHAREMRGDLRQPSLCLALRLEFPCLPLGGLPP